MSERLQSLAELNRSRGGLHQRAYPRLNGIECPSCKAEMVDTEEPKDPMQQPVGCPRCGYAYWRVA